MRATISLSELIVRRLLTLDLSLFRRISEGRDKASFEDFEEDEEDEELDDDDDLPRAPLAHLVIACSTTEAKAPSRPPARNELEEEDVNDDDGEEGRVLAGDEIRTEGGRLPL